MRIVAGEKRGMTLLAPDGLDTRPTTDRVKEALFSVIQFEVAGKTVLDLFAGSGALGIEALSRGAGEAVFIDMDNRTIEIIRKNLKKAGFTDKATIIKENYVDAIKLFQNTHKFDIVFVDPPYKSDYYAHALMLLANEGALHKNSVVIAEGEEPLQPGNWPYKIRKSKRYGKTFLTFLSYEGIE
ncbi:MAG: 16S rRNA (guanine(966)-N(2))-methyltransferase RsmD [Christensenellaceae bacterium]|jgi:16S rRNA (guanine966-N2)-methyltransferase